MVTIIKTVTRDQYTLEKYDYRDAMEIYIGDKRMFRVGDGEPEDSNMSRDFNDVHRITDMLMAAYDLGQRGVKVEFVSEESEDI